MAMTRKDYKAFAEMLKDVRKEADKFCEVEGGPEAHWAIEEIEKEMIRIFKADNPRFQEGFFREASGSLK